MNFDIVEYRKHYGLLHLLLCLCTLLFAFCFDMLWYIYYSKEMILLFCVTSLFIFIIFVLIADNRKYCREQVIDIRQNSVYYEFTVPYFKEMYLCKNITKIQYGIFFVRIYGEIQRTLIRTDEEKPSIIVSSMQVLSIPRCFNVDNGLFEKLKK